MLAVLPVPGWGQSPDLSLTPPAASLVLLGPRHGHDVPWSRDLPPSEIHRPSQLGNQQESHPWGASSTTGESDSLKS